MFLAPHQLLMTVYNNRWGEAREQIYVAAHWQFYEVGVVQASPVSIVCIASYARRIQWTLLK